MTNIYIITNLITKQQYVGKTIHSIEHRFYEHCHDSQSSTYIDVAIRKYGASNFRVDLLYQCEDSEWQHWEKHFIKCMHTHYTEGGYNISRGGDINPMDDPECRKHHLNAIRDPERLAKIAKKALGRKHTAESRSKMSQIQKALYEDPKLRYKVKMNQPNRKCVYMINDGHVVKKFDSLSDACRYFNRPTTNAGRLQECVDAFNKNGKRCKFWGYNWSYNAESVTTRDVVVS